MSMLKRVLSASTMAGLLLVGLSGHEAKAVPTCTSETVADYTAAGFSCDYNGLTFSDFVVKPLSGGSAVLALGDFSPITLTGPSGNQEFGFSLNFFAHTGTLANSFTDIDLTYNVTADAGFSITDALIALTGSVTGTGQISLSEAFVPNVGGLSLTGQGSQELLFPFPVASLTAIKDQSNFAGPAGSAVTSDLINAFSVTACNPAIPPCLPITNPPLDVPEPGSLIMLGSALVGLGGVGWYRRRQRELSAGVRASWAA